MDASDGETRYLLGGSSVLIYPVYTMMNLWMGAKLVPGVDERIGRREICTYEFLVDFA